MGSLSMLFIIVNQTDEKKILKIINKYKIGFKYLVYGSGTASSSMLEYFGLNEEKKIVVMSIVPVMLVRQILRELQIKIGVDDLGKGIAFSISLSSGTKYMLNYYENQEMEVVDMDSVDMHLIVAITNEGYSEKVMNEAKKVGATGGTTINGRGLESSKAIKLFNMTIEPEKDIILILVPTDKKNFIMNTIVDNCGLKTPGAGICFSLPVDHAIGLNKGIE